MDELQAGRKELIMAVVILPDHSGCVAVGLVVRSIACCCTQL